MSRGEVCDRSGRQPKCPKQSRTIKICKPSQVPWHIIKNCKHHDMILVFRPCYISFDDGQCVTVTLEKINSDYDVADYPALSVDRAGGGNPLYAEDTPNQEFLIRCTPIQEFLNWCVTNQDHLESMMCSAWNQDISDLRFWSSKLQISSASTSVRPSVYPTPSRTQCY